MTARTRRRFLLAASILVAVAAAAALFIPIPKDGIVLLVGADSIRARTGPALALRNPLSTRVVRVPPDPVTLQAVWRLRSPQGPGRAVAIRLEAGPDPSGPPGKLLELALDPQPFLDREAAGLRAEVEAAVADADAADDAAREQALQEALGDALRRRALLVRSLHLEPVEPAATLVPQETGVRLLVVGLDSADWDLIDPMLAAGKLPTLARLRRDGAWGWSRGDEPRLSPLLWTTAATGRPPDIHGILDFVMIDAATGLPIPISSNFRRVKAFWNILSDAGLPVDVVGWWATWPAEPIEGVMATDRLAYSLFRYDQAGDDRGVTFPPSYGATAARLRVTPADVSWEELSALARIDRADFDRSTAALAAGDATDDDSLVHLRRTVAATLTYQRIALDLLQRSPPRLLAVYYQGLDEVNHRFAHLSPPALPLAKPGEAARFGGTIEAFYELQDRLLGELIHTAPADTNVLVLSDHGFANGDERPRGFLPYVEGGMPGRWHTPEGIWLLDGPVARPGRLAGTVGLDQLTPTLLRLLGLPLAADMPDPVEAAIRTSFLERFPSRRIPTYEDGATKAAEPRALPAPDDAAVLERLRSLGYVAASGEAAPGAERSGGTTANYHANLGSILLGRRELARAAEEFRRALEREPGHLMARAGLIQIDILEGRRDEALEAITNLVEEAPEYDPVYYYRAAELYGETGRGEEGLEWFRSLAAGQPGVVQVQVGLGMMLRAAGDLAGARQAFRTALDRRPDALIALQELFRLEMPGGSLDDLMARIQSAIQAAPREPMPYNWAGLVLRRQRRPKEAEASFRRALEIDPDSLQSLVNLSSLLLNQRRDEEAIPLCRRALELDPDSQPPRVNLILALGGAGRLPEAQAVFDEAGGEQAATVGLLNAMAFAAQQNDADDQARRLLQRSLQLRPDQPDARRLLDRVGGGG